MLPLDKYHEIIQLLYKGQRFKRVSNFKRACFLWLKSAGYGFCRKCKVVKCLDLEFSKGERSRQCAQFCRDCKASYHRLYRQANPEAIRKALKRSAAKYPEKAFARRKLNDAVKGGLISKPALCDMCRKVRKLQGHHPDYSRPLDVAWLCARCHATEEEHQTLRDQRLDLIFTRV